MRNAFNNTSLKIERTTESICNHYYNKMMTFEKIKRGGKRERSGRNPKYNEPTKTTAFRIPLSKIDEVKKIVRVFLAGYERENNQ